MVWGWFIPCLFVITVAASIAELVSSMPYAYSFLLLCQVLITTRIGRVPVFIISRQRWPLSATRPWPAGLRVGPT